MKRRLGITLDSTEGLMSEKQFKKVSGLTRIADYRKQGLIKPVGYAINNAGISPFFHPRQVDELKKALGITLDSTERLMNESEFAKASGRTMIATYRKQGLIKPAGRAMTGTGVSFFYHPRQIAELNQRLAELRSR